MKLSDEIVTLLWDARWWWSTDEIALELQCSPENVEHHLHIEWQRHAPRVHRRWSRDRWIWRYAEGR